MAVALSWRVSAKRIQHDRQSHLAYRILMLKASAAQEVAPTQVNVVLNWFEEMKRLAHANP